MRAVLFLLFAFIFSLPIKGQCYGEFRKEGLNFAGIGNYEQAINQYLIALNCPDKPSSGDDVPELIKQALESWRKQHLGANRKNEELRKKIEDLQKEIEKYEHITSEDRAWINALKSHTIEAYQTYIRNYPRGKYLSESIREIEKLDDKAWEAATHYGGTQAYRDYLKARPKGKYSIEANKRIHFLTNMQTIRVNGLTWMAENLNFDIGEGCWCYNEAPGNCQKYGRLYTWEAANNACREAGWRLPTDEEWDALEGFYFGSNKSYEALITGGGSGFNALLGGYRNKNGSFFSLGAFGNYWSATENGPDKAWRYKFYSSQQEILRHSDSKSEGYSCRCVKN